MEDDLPDADLAGGTVDTSKATEPVALGTELWFARRVAREHGDSLKYVWAWRSWMAWDPNHGRWQRDAGAAAWSAAKATVQNLLYEAGIAAGEDPVRGQQLLKAGRRFMSRHALESALRLTQSEPAIVALTDEWDAQPTLLNCANGTVDLSTGLLLPHDRAHRLTKTTGVEFCPGADATQFLRFIESILPDAEVRDYIQRAFGVTAFGDVREHLLHIAWGGGSNGKSVLFNAILAAMGEYGTAVPSSLLVSTNFQNDETAIATLDGVRFAVASEPAEGGRLDEARLKRLTGGDVLVARRLYGHQWNMKPSHSLWLQTNFRPRVLETSHALWRRMRLLPFVVIIPTHLQDKGLTARLKRQASGILAWIVAGAGRYLSQGLEPPAAVQVATEQYAADEDPLREFMAKFESGGFTPSKAIYAEYCDWAEENGIKPWGQRTLTTRLRDRGWEYVKRATSTGFRVSGVRKSNAGDFSEMNPRMGKSADGGKPNTTISATPHCAGIPEAHLKGDDTTSDPVDSILEADRSGARPKSNMTTNEEGSTDPGVA